MVIKLEPTNSFGDFRRREMLMSSSTQEDQSLNNILAQCPQLQNVEKRAEVAKMVCWCGLALSSIGRPEIDSQRLEKQSEDGKEVAKYRWSHHHHIRQQNLPAEEQHLLFKEICRHFNVPLASTDKDSWEELTVHEAGKWLGEKCVEGNEIIRVYMDSWTKEWEVVKVQGMGLWQRWMARHSRPVARAEPTHNSNGLMEGDQNLGQ